MPNLLQKTSNWQVALLFLLLGFSLYANTLSHDYALDDAIVITENEFTNKGYEGVWDHLTNDVFTGFYGVKKELVSGGRYRPLSPVIFSIQHEWFGNQAWIGHLTNVLFYILNGFLLYLLLKRLLKDYKFKSEWISFPLLVSLLWFFHPIHTEAVANIKGLDEILTFCLLLLSLILILKFIDKKQWGYLFIAAISFFLALLSKENAITWLAVIPFAIFFFTDLSFKRSLPIYLMLIGVAGIWFYLRYEIVGGFSSNADSIMNDPFLETADPEKYATIMFTLAKYVQLMLFPHPLTFDYYPQHIPIMSWNEPMVILSVVLYMGLIIFAVMGLTKKKLYSFSILFFFATISVASNIVFIIGAFMNERFVYISSLSISLILAYALLRFTSKYKSFAQLLLIVVLSLYSIKTISRNSVWENNYTLSTNDAEISINGAKSNIMAGGTLIDEALKPENSKVKKLMLEQSIMHLNRAIAAFPDYVDAWVLLGNANWQLSNSARQAMPFYQNVLNMNPVHSNTWRNVLFVLESDKDTDYKIQSYQTLLRYNPSKIELYIELGTAYGRDKNDLNNAQKYLEQGLKIAPTNIEILTSLGTLYGLQRNYSKAIEVLNKAIDIRPDLAKSHVDLGLSYYLNGQFPQAKQAYAKALELDPTLDSSKFPKIQ